MEANRDRGTESLRSYKHRDRKGCFFQKMSHVKDSSNVRILTTWEQKLVKTDLSLHCAEMMGKTHFSDLTTANSKTEFERPRKEKK